MINLSIIDNSAASAVSDREEDHPFVNINEVK
jgi:hypothetical protein